MENNWISVKERMPESDGNILLYDSQTDCFEVGNFIVELRYFTSNLINSGDVTHWMGLPERPG